MAYNIFDMQEVRFDYNVDIVMCIDATGSMDPILDEVKRTALAFDQMFREAMENTRKTIDQLRVKVIAFRDYMVDAQPMRESPFYVLPDQREEFKHFVDSIEACGGGDEPENALEAIATALSSDWVTTGSKRRHVILLFTDASALELNQRKECRNYPRNLPKTLPELNEWWEGCSQYYYSNYQAKSGRLVMFCPKVAPWTHMESWNRRWAIYTHDYGLKGTDMNAVIDLLTGSVQ